MGFEEWWNEQEAEAEITPLPEAPAPAPPRTAPQGGTRGKGSAFSDWWQEQEQGRIEDESVGHALQRAEGVDPDAEARNRRIARETGLSIENVAADPKGAEALARTKAIDPAKLRQDSPVLARFLGQGDLAPLAIDDLEALSLTERAIRALKGYARTGGFAPAGTFAAGAGLAGAIASQVGSDSAFRRIPEAWQQGQAIVRLGELRYRQMIGEATEDELAEIERVKELTQPQDYGEENWLSSALLSTAEILPTTLAGGLEFIKGFTVAAPVGAGAAAIAGQAGPQVAVPEEVVTVPLAASASGVAGGTTMAARYAHRLEAGLAYDEFLEYRDELGNPLDENTRQLAAHAVGGINAMLEVVGLGALSKILPGKNLLTRVAARKAVREAIRRPTRSRAAVTGVGRLVTSVGGEAVTETLQELSPILIGETAKRMSDQPFEARDFSDPAEREQLVAELSEVAWKTIEGMAVLAIPGVGGNLVIDLAGAKQAEKDLQSLEALADPAQRAKLRERDPDAYRVLAQQMAEAEDLEAIYVDVAAWDNYWTSSGQDPALAASEILGGPEAYAEARKTRTLAIPIGRYMEKMAGSDAHQALLPDLRTAPDKLSTRQAQESALEARAIVEEYSRLPVSEMPEEDLAIYESFYQALTDAGHSPAAADANARLMQARFRVLAERWNKNAEKEGRRKVTPAELFSRYDLTIANRGAGQVSNVPPVRVTKPQAEQAAATPIPDPEPQPAEAPAPEGARSPGAERAPSAPGARTDAGGSTFAFGMADPNERYPLEYVVVDLDELVTSHDTEGVANPAYPGELQPWNRGSAASRGQVAAIGATAAADSLLVEQHALDRGAPIVAEDSNVVESGNGRTLGLRKARDAGNAAWQRYVERVGERAAEMGLSIEGVANPVLVRRRRFPLDGDARIAFTREANGRVSKTPSPVEQAGMDAEKITLEMLESLPAPEKASIDDVLVTHEGQRWVRSFLETLHSSEHARFMDSEGRIGLQGIRALHHAIFLRVYGDAGKAILEGTAEIAGDARQNLEMALMGSLPRMARLVGGIEREAVRPEYAVAEQLGKAVNVLRKLRRDGTVLEDYLRQQTLLGRDLDSFGEAILRTLYENSRRGRRVAAYLDEYANAAMRVPPPSQGGLFSDIQPPSALDLWTRAVQEVDTQLEEEQRKLYQGPAGLPAEPAPPARGSHPREWVEYGKKVDEWLTEVAALGELPFFAPLKGDREGGVIVHRTVSGEAQAWRVTHFDTDMTPTGHQVAGSYLDALKLARDSRADLGARQFPDAAADPNQGRRLYQSAWHGGPTDHDGFSLEFIGSGEGAAAYGWGIYFAESRGVADSYRSTLSRGRGDEERPRWKGADEPGLLYWGNRTLASYIFSSFNFADRSPEQVLLELQAAHIHGNRPLPNSMSVAMRDALAEATTQNIYTWAAIARIELHLQVESAIREQRASLKNQRDFLERLPKSAPAARRRDMHIRYTAEQRILKEMERLRDEGEVVDGKRNEGQLFKVDLDVSPADLIPYDYTIDVWPAEAVEKLVGMGWLHPRTTEFVRVQEELEDLQYRAARVSGLNEDQKARYREVHAQHKALKAEIDAATAGTDQLGTLELSTITGEKLYRRIAMVAGSPRRASEALAAAGFSGIQYLDGASRASGEGSFNYVIFDPDRITIERKLFQSEPEGPRLVTLHNLTEANLDFADGAGGLPAPSIAITRDDAPLTGFGEITLIATPEFVDPKSGTPVFSSDIYSARQPRAVHKVDARLVSQIDRRLRPYAERVGADAYLELEDALRAGAGEATGRQTRDADLRRMWRLAYLEEVLGWPQEIPQKARAVRYAWSGDAAIAAFIEQPHIQAKSAEHRAFSEAVSLAFDNYAEAFVDNEGVARALETLRGRMFDDDGLVHFGKVDAIIRDSQAHRETVADTDALDAQLDQQLSHLEDGALEAWIREQLEPAVGDAFIETRSPSTGRVTRKAYTLENVLRSMKRKLRAAEEGGMGVGLARSSVAKKFSSLEGIKKARDRVVTEPEMNALKEEAQKRFFEYAEKLEQYHAGGNAFFALDAIIEALVESQKRGKTLAAELKLSGYDNVPAGLVAEGYELLDYLREMPTSYFEAKPQRVVKLDEFAAAVVPEDASPETLEILRKNGVTNIQRYKRHDNGSRAEAIRRAGLEANALFQEDETGDKRGVFLFKGKRKFEIQLLEDADLSTFAHESMHFFVEVMRDLAQDPNAPAEVLADWRRLMAWAGDSLDGEVSEAAHEKIAAAWEVYLGEGRAPSQDLVSTFARFRSWILAIYRKLTNKGVALNPEVRGIFDRMLATDEEIAQVSESMQYHPLWGDASSAGVTSEEFAELRRLNTEARIEAEEDLFAKQAAAAGRERERYRREIRGEITEEVEAEIAGQRVHQARHLLRTGRNLDGSEVPPGREGIKLSKQDLVDQFGKDVLKDLRGLYSRNGGMDTQAVAEEFGYTTAQEMIEDLRSAPERSAIVKEEVAKRLEAALPPETGGAIGEGAMESLHSDKRGQLLEREIKLLAGRVGVRTRNPRHAARAAAERIVSQTEVRKLAPHQFARSEATARRMALEAAARGDHAAALEYVQKQLLYFELYRAALAGRAEADAIARRLRDAASDKTRARFGREAQSYVDQIEKILARLGLRRVSNKRIAEMESLFDWYKEQLALGNEVAIPPELLDESQRKHYRAHTLEELRGIRDSIDNILHLARLKKKLALRAKRRDYEAVKAELIAALQENMQDPGPIPLSKTERQRTVFQKIKNKAKGFHADLLRIEQLIDWFDGGEADGAWSQNFFDQIADAQAEEETLSLEITAKIVELLEQLPKKVRKRLFNERIYFKSLGQALYRHEVLAAVLNMGNESNLTKLLEGRPQGVQRWDAGVLRELLDTLTKEEMDLVQGIWDTLESLWPKVEALEHRMSGIAPEKIPATPVVTKHGIYRGGYYPVVYDPEQSKQGQLKESESGVTAELFHRNMARAITPHGHTKSRVKFARPILLDLNVLPRHLTEVIHDLSHREALINMYRVVMDDDVWQALNRYAGHEHANAIVSWIKSLAGVDLPGEARAWEGFVMQTRANMTVAAMGFKATTVVAQLMGLSASLDMIESKWLIPALGEFFSNPAAKWREIEEKSPEMRSRVGNLDNNLRRQLRRNLGKSNLYAQAQEFAFRGIGAVDMLIALPTWLAGYNKALAENKSEEAAVRAGDRLVRLSQGSGAPKDLAAVQRSPAFKWFTMFYTYFAAMYARNSDLIRSGKLAKDEGNLLKSLPRLLSRSFFLWAVPATLGEYIAGRGPEDDEDTALWFLKMTLVYPFLAIPGIRDVLSSAEAGFDYKMSPIASLLDSATEAISKAGEFVQGERDLQEVAEPTFEGLGYLFGAPVAQIRITGSYLRDVLTGEEDPESVREFLRNLAYRRRD